MKLIIVTAVLCLFSVGVRAQTISLETPPVKVLKVKNHGLKPCDIGADNCVYVWYQSTVPQTAHEDLMIIAVEFNIVFIDVMGNRHTYPHNFLMEEPVKAGKSGMAIFYNPLFSGCHDYEATVVKVAFAGKPITHWEAPSVTNSSTSQTNLGDQKQP